MEKIKDDAILIFAGPAGIDAANMGSTLDQELPDKLGPAVVQRDIPRDSHQGLRDVHAWMTSVVGRRGLDRPESLKQYIGALGAEQLERTYLVILWGDNGDEETEELVAFVQQMGITVLDLTDGLDDFRLSDDPPEVPAEEPAAPATPQTPTARRRRGGSLQRAVEPGRQDDAASTPPWEPLRMPADEFALVKIAAIALEGALQSIREYMASLTVAPDAEEPEVIVPEIPAKVPGQEKAKVQPEQARSPAPRQAASRRRSQPVPAGTRAWLRDPDKKEDDPGAYFIRGVGRPIRERKEWPTVYLTPQQEKDLGADDTRE